MNQVRLLEKTKNGLQFDASGKHEVIKKDLYITEKQMKDHVRYAGKSGIMYVEVVTNKEE